MTRLVGIVPLHPAQSGLHNLLRGLCELSESLRVAPRAGVAWTPFEKLGTVVRAGFGWFYDHVPLSVYSFAQYPNEIVTMFGPGGQITAGPSLYRNGLGTVSTKSAFVFQETNQGNFSPRSATGNVQIEQPVSQYLCCGWATRRRNPMDW